MAKDVNIHISLGSKEAEEALGSMVRHLSESGDLFKVIARAQNKVIASMRGETVKEIRAIYLAPSAKIRETMRVSKADHKNLYASLTLKGKMSIEMIHHDAQQTPKGTSVRVLRGSKRGLIQAGGDTNILTTKKHKYPATFIAKGRKSGRRHVLARVEDKDHPVMLWGPSFMGALSRQEVEDGLRAKAAERFTKEVLREANAVLQGFIKPRKSAKKKQ